MEWRIINSKNIIYFLALFFFLLYAFGATNNSSLDAWAYAADVSKGDNLFAPHHLLYSLLGYLWVGVINIFVDADVLLLLKLLNAFFAAAILFVLFRFLGVFNNNTRINLLLVALVGSSWGIMRFATENETYIVPLFFSLLGSFLLVKDESEKNIIFSGLFAALATLFHQVMFFWWLGLMLGLVFKRNVKNITLFILPASIVPIVYSLVVYLKYGTFSVDLFFRFVFSDYFSGAASLELGAKSVLLLFIGAFRSFVQVHGYIGNLLTESYWFWIAGFTAVALIVTGLFVLIRNFRFLNLKNTPILWIYLVIALFQLAFALLAGGNSEFLVMLPVLAAIILINFENISSVALGLMVAGVFVWNISFGLIPLKYKTLDGSSMVVNHIASNSEKSAYILYSLPRIENELNYKGVKNNSILIKYNQQGVSIADTMNTLLKNGYSVYTDVYNRPKTLSRENMVFDLNDIQRVFENYSIEPTDSVRSISGEYYLHLIISKNNN